MASKFGLAGGIPERKVRPIWDAIDSRQFKNALKHVSTLLAKHPNSPYALVRTLICTLITFVDIEFALFFLCCWMRIFQLGSESARAGANGEARRSVVRCAQREGASLRQWISVDGWSHSQHFADCVSAIGSLLVSFVCLFCFLLLFVMLLCAIF